MIGIYQIKCLVNGKSYIGQSIHIENRLSHHKSELKCNRHRNCYLQRAINLYGLENFSFEIIHTLTEDEYSVEKLNELERYYIAFFHSDCRENGYNIERGGLSNGTMPEESRIKLSIAHAGKKYGRRSEETRALMRQNACRYWLGKKMSDLARQNMSNARKGKPVSEEIRKKQAEAQKGSIWVHKQQESHFIKPDKLEEYLANGYELGRPYFKRDRAYSLPRKSKKRQNNKQG